MLQLTGQVLNFLKRIRHNAHGGDLPEGAA